MSLQAEVPSGPAAVTNGLRHRLVPQEQVDDFEGSSAGYVAKAMKPATSEPLLESSSDDGQNYVEDNSPLMTIKSFIRCVLCVLILAVGALLWSVLLLLLLPWKGRRIYMGMLYGTVSGYLCMKVLGNPVKITGQEHSRTTGIYVCNHASPVDVTLTMWLCPNNLTGIAKNEIIFWPFFGQLYWLAGHLRIDRSNPQKAVASLKKAAEDIKMYRLSVAIFPEGTRSKDGRLLPFKKGAVHLAIQTGLPICPVVLGGTHHACPRGRLKLRPAPLAVTFLPPIDTSAWSTETADEHVQELYDLFVKNLPPSQKPLPSALAKASESSSLK